MIHWNNLSLQEAITLWRQHRADLSDLPDAQSRITQTTLFFSQVPYGSRTLDFYTPSSWPTPWEIFQYGEFCKSSISLLIYHTLSIVDPDINIELAIVDNNGDIFVAPIVDRQHIINLIPGELVDISTVTESVKIKEYFDTTQIKKFA